MPITDADGAMKLLEPGRAGATPSTDIIRVEGTSRSIYFATSMLAPILSSAALDLRWCGLNFKKHEVGEKLEGEGKGKNQM